MRKFLSKLALAAVTVLLLGSCSEINERIDKLESRLNGVENEAIKDISAQVSAISQSIADLGTIRSSIQSLTSTVGTQGGDITALQSADEALGGRIDELNNYVNGELVNYAKTEWVEATFLTLKEYEKTCDTIAKIDARIGALNTRLSGEIAAAADSLKGWINVQFGSYYTAAQMDAKLEALQAEIDSTDAENKAKADSIAAELTEAKAAVDSAKANIRAEYRAAIDTAITALDGKLSKAIQDSIASVNGRLEHLTGWVKAIDKAVYALTGRVEKLEQMIQSVVIVPAYSDGSVEAINGVLELNLIVSPSSAVEGLTKEKVNILLNTAATKAVSVDTVKADKITSFTVDDTKGTVEIKADISSKINALQSNQLLTVAVNVTNGDLSDFTTEFVGITTVVKALTFKAVYDTNNEANTLTFYYDYIDHSGEGITVYEGSTLFDDTQTQANKKWGYNTNRANIKDVKIDASVAGYSGLTSTAYMFQGMIAASDISGAEYLVVSNVTDMSYMFMNFGGGNTNSHTTLNSVPDVSEWNTANVTNMAGMFNSYGNFSDNLAIVPDVSNWNTGNVTNMSYMFQKYGHESQNFNAVPDVSKWDTGNVTNMTNMFSEYGHKSTSLGTVPDVSKWNTAKVGNMNSMFECFADSSTVLAVVPDVSKWNTVKVTDMGDMFNDYGHKSTVLDTVPDVSKWKTDSVGTMTNMFKNYGYSSIALSTVPNVSSWKTSNVTNISDMFQNYGYSSIALSTVPNVSSWKTSNVTNISDMFQNYGYSSTELSTVPDVSKWETGKMENISNMFQFYGNTSQSINCTLDLSGWDLSKITSGLNVFQFKPSTFNVTIPAKTGDKANEVGNWYFGDGTDSIVPPTGKTFTPALAGVFSVSATKKVHFSKGNLVYDYSGTPSGWNFAEHQYDCVGSVDNGKIDLFCWSTDADNNNWGFLHFIGYSPANVAGDFKDWGQNIGDGKTWRTLSDDEWIYLLSTRNVNGGSGPNKSYSLEITYGGKKGLVIYPDDYSGDAISGTVTELPDGVVFLPAAGYSMQGTITKSNEHAYYWTSSYTPSENEHAVVIQFTTGMTSNFVERMMGCCVRLVTEVK